jgi:hypothetical protein
MGGIIEYLASACKPTNETQAQVSMNEQSKLLIRHLFVCLMVFNATFNNISAISWRSVLLVEETGGSGENHRPVASH